MFIKHLSKYQILKTLLKQKVCHKTRYLEYFYADRKKKKQKTSIL